MQKSERLEKMMQNNLDPREYDTMNKDHQSRTFWRSRAGVYFVVALTLVGLLLGFEHRDHIFSSGWLIWLPLLLCVAMHFFMHGHHGERK
ncbi:DUF2933 domain-containing protein [Labrenzia sp. R4_2]|uniref:DUF2933 domain-containing protein n=1 Tax=Labrenzia sp. R4_2 TaxID=2821107 RepID=UPI00336ABADD